MNKKVTDKMKTISTTIFVLLSISGIAQDRRYEEYVPLFKSEILSEENLKNQRHSRILRDLTYVGAYQELYERNKYQDSTIVEAMEEITKTYSPTNAKELILKMASAEQLVIINESHHRPEHRKFTADLLSDLYKQGFRYLALEAIMSNSRSEFTKYPENKYYLGDTTITERGYPLMKPCSGTYVKEPAFGNMIREALSLGYQIVGYEKLGKERELYQAKNLARIFEYDPSAKMVIHCGYGHLIESPAKRKNRTDTLMAAHLKAITNINPLTIDQTNYYYLTDINEIVFNETSATSPQCLTLNDTIFKSHLAEQQNYWDMTVFHPPIEYTEGRPHWLTLDSKNKKFVLDASKIVIDYPIRIKLHEAEDRLDAVPIDILESYDYQDDYTLYGKIDNAKFVIQNINGDRQIISME